MHEQSETIQQPDGRWINVYGKGLPRAGKQLPGTPTYSSVQEASNEASRRSRNFRSNEQNKQYMQDVKTYLAGVQANKQSYTQRDVYAPQFSQAREDGYFRNPPTDKSYVQAPPLPADKSYGDKLRGWLQQQFKGESWRDRFIRPGQQSQVNPSFFHEPGVMVGESVGPIAQGAWANANEPKKFDVTGSIGGAGKFLKKPSWFRDAGGFQVTPSEMLRADPGVGRVGDDTAHVADYMFGRTLENRTARGLMKNDPEERFKMSRFAPEEQSRTNRVKEGLTNLEQDVTRSTWPERGGGVPPEHMAGRNLVTTYKAPPPMAPADFLGTQQGYKDIPGYDMYNLTKDIHGHPAGSTVSDITLKRMGFGLPPKKP